MKLYFDKLPAHLAQGGRTLYLLHGDEPWQMMQAGDQLRAHARATGYAEREVIVINEEADWGRFEESANNLSLFAPRRMLDVRLPSGKPGRRGGEILKRHAETMPEDIFLLLSSARLDSNATRSAWYKSIDKAGGILAVWPMPLERLGAWLERRLREQGLHPEKEALRVLGERVEGNLLAAAQEIERLALLCEPGVLSAEAVLDAVADSARYSLSDLSDATLGGDAARALRVLEGLLQEGVAEVLILWTLSQDVRVAARAAEAAEQGVSIERALASAGVWKSRLPLLQQAVPRFSAQEWLRLLSDCTRIDRQIKGQTMGSVDDAMRSLVAALAGGPALRLAPHRSLN